MIVTNFETKYERFSPQPSSADTEDEDSARPSASSGSSSRGTSVDEQFTGVSIRVSTLCAPLYCDLVSFPVFLFSSLLLCPGIVHRSCL